MSRLTLYDYNNDNAEVNILAGIVSLNDIININPGRKTIDNVTWNIAKTITGSYASVTFTASGFDYDVSNLNGDVALLGIDNRSLYQSILNLSVGDNFTYGFLNDPNHSYPYYNMGRDIPSSPAPNETRTWLRAYANSSSSHGFMWTFIPAETVGGIFPIVADKGDGSYYIGEGYVRALYQSNPSMSTVTISLYIHRNITTDGYMGDPGDKGFRPTGAYTSKFKPGNGGLGTSQKKDPDYAGSAISQPGAPNESAASAINCGFLTVYKINQANLDAIGKNLYGETLLDLVKNISVNPLDFIVSLMIFPCSPASLGASQNIKLGGWQCAAAGGAVLNALGTPAVGSPLTSQFKVVDFGTVSIPENWGSFLDYSQTTIEMYLPFIGSVNIDVSECMGGTINVQYTIDFLTGMCVANVLCTKANYVLPSGKALSYVHAQHAFQGNCAIQIPLSAVNYGSMIGSLINACTQGITNPVSGFMGIANDAIGGGFRPNVSSKGNIVANAGFCSILYPYIRITRPITAEPDSYQKVMGLPSYINTTLGECEDLCICDGIDLKGISGATESELQRIRQLCSEGVYV